MTGEGNQRQQEEQAEKQRVPKSCEEHLEPNLRAASGNDPERAGIAFLTAHDGIWRLGPADIGNIGGIYAGKVIQKVFNILWNAPHLRRIAIDVGGIEPELGIFGGLLNHVVVERKLQPAGGIALNRFSNVLDNAVVEPLLLADQLNNRNRDHAGKGDQHRGLHRNHAPSQPDAQRRIVPRLHDAARSRYPSPRMAWISTPAPLSLRRNREM
ncbi:hypothetical protein N8D56_11115 [Devosia sp. A8/3-2]|nr:hypothetical protein N8D56_11115 [Devosia sp. A8/3-2]